MEGSAPEPPLSGHDAAGTATAPKGHIASFRSPSTSPPMSKSRSPSPCTSSTITSGSLDTDAVKAPSSTTSETHTAQDLDLSAIGQRKLSVARSQKARAQTPQTVLEGHARPRSLLSTELVGRILEYYQPACEAEFLPCSIGRIRDRAQRARASEFLSMLRWRTVMLEMRLINAHFKDAVDSHYGWAHVYSMIAEEQALATALSSPNVNFFRLANVALSNSCAACVLNYGNSEEKLELFLQDTGYGVLDLCEDHCTAPAVEVEDESACCTVCLVGSIIEEEAALFPNEDVQNWPWAITTCYWCRCTAASISLGPLAKVYPREVLQKLCGANRAHREYLDCGVGAAFQALQAVTEDIWLYQNTGYDTIRQNCLYRRRHAHRKAWEKKVAAMLERNPDFEVPEIADWPESFLQLPDSDDLRCRAEALEGVTWETLFDGFWMSPMEMWSRFGATRRISPGVFDLQPAADGEQMIQLPELPPATLMDAVEHTYWRVYEYLITKALEALCGKVQNSEGPEKRFQCSNDWQATDLLSKLQDADCWAFIGQARMPTVPKSLLQIGEKTAARMEAVWFHVSAPLRECSCGICARSKRKRDDSGEKADGDDPSSNRVAKKAGIAP